MSPPRFIILFLGLQSCLSPVFLSVPGVPLAHRQCGQQGWLCVAICMWWGHRSMSRQVENKPPPDPCLIAGPWLFNAVLAKISNSNWSPGVQQLTVWRQKGLLLMPHSPTPPPPVTPRGTAHPLSLDGVGRRPGVPAAPPSLLWVWKTEACQGRVLCAGP